MVAIAYRETNFRAGSLATIDKVNEICESYARQGFDLTLRQLYYQFVARGLIPNRQTEYDKLGETVNAGRLGGLIDWDYITDRTRNVAGGDGMNELPSETINPYYFAAELWQGQTERVEVWVEKEALAQIVQQAAAPLRARYFSCRGYVSQSEMWSAAQRLEEYLSNGAEHVTILHLGDHDPSGIDMTRDIEDRLAMFFEGDGYYPGDLEVRRIALNIDQVRQYNPPPNPTKLTDSRAGSYLRNFGRESWELDALEPSVLRDLIQNDIRDMIDADKWAARRKFEKQGQETLRAVKDHYDDVIAYLDSKGWLPEVELDDDDEPEPVE